MNIEDSILQIVRSAKKASTHMATCQTEQKNNALLKLVDLIESNKQAIIAENKKDLVYGQEKGLSPAMLDRLIIRDKTICSMTDGLRTVARLDDPVGSVSCSRICENGLEVSKMCIPLGVIGMIYESRPNVTIDAAGLCLKAGNAIILRGGSEAFHSNMILASLVSEALSCSGLPASGVQIVPFRNREAVDFLLKQEEYVDLIIPRGGEGLIRHVVAHSSIPVLKHYKGVCHAYVDEGANLEMARAICINAKVQRPGVCNALETMLVNRKEAERFLPIISKDLRDVGVTLRGCPLSCKIVPEMEQAKENDWHAEYLDLILSVKIVETMDEAIHHISRYGSNHTEAIITRDYNHSRRFVREVDASLVIVNASTRFNDGGELGLGAEIGISTSKLHSYGPMGINELTTSKNIAWGCGQIRM